MIVLDRASNASWRQTEPIRDAARFRPNLPVGQDLWTAQSTAADLARHLKEEPAAARWLCPYAAGHNLGSGRRGLSTECGTGQLEARDDVDIEAQHQYDVGFPRRVFIYHVRLVDQFDRPVLSLAILGDADPGWRPGHYQADVLGCEVSFRFPIVKLLDYRARLAELAAERNPFAAVVLAHLAALATRRNPTGRWREKSVQVRRLYEMGYARDEVIQLFRLIDWLLRLPAGLEQAFRQELHAYEEERDAIPDEYRAVALERAFGEAGRAVAEELAEVTGGDPDGGGRTASNGDDDRGGPCRLPAGECLMPCPGDRRWSIPTASGMTDQTDRPSASPWAGR